MDYYVSNYLYDNQYYRDIKQVVIQRDCHHEKVKANNPFAEENPKRKRQDINRFRYIFIPPSLSRNVKLLSRYLNDNASVKQLNIRCVLFIVSLMDFNKTVYIPANPHVNTKLKQMLHTYDQFIDQNKQLFSSLNVFISILYTHQSQFKKAIISDPLLKYFSEYQSFRQRILENFGRDARATEFIVEKFNADCHFYDDTNCFKFVWISIIHSGIDIDIN